MLNVDLDGTYLDPGVRDRSIRELVFKNIALIKKLNLYPHQKPVNREDFNREKSLAGIPA